MKFANIKRIIVEDFPEDQRDTVSKLGFVINNAFEQLVQILNKNLSISDNLNESVVSIDVSVDANGSPLAKTQLKYGLSGKYTGVVVLNASNQTNPALYPVSAPAILLQYLPTGLLQVNRVYGLQPNNKYTLTLRITGGN